MSTRPSAINLVIKSNLPSDIDLELFNPSSITSPANQRKQYSWDITYQQLTHATTVSMQVKTRAGDAFTTYTSPLLTKDRAGLVAALNALNVGVFFSFNQAGIIYASVLNDVIIYGELDIQIQTPSVGLNGFASMFLFANDQVNGSVVSGLSDYVATMQVKLVNPVHMYGQVVSSNGNQYEFDFGVMPGGNVFSYAQVTVPKSVINAFTGTLQYFILADDGTGKHEIGNRRNITLTALNSNSSQLPALHTSISGQGTQVIELICSFTAYPDYNADQFPFYPALEFDQGLIGKRTGNVFTQEVPVPDGVSGEVYPLFPFLVGGGAVDIEYSVAHTLTSGTKGTCYMILADGVTRIPASPSQYLFPILP